MTAALAEQPTAPAPQAQEAGRRWTRAVWVLPPVVIVLIIAVYPLVRVLTSSFDGDGTSSWSGVLGSELFRTALVTTAQIAILSTLGCLVLGTFIAVVLAFVPFPGSRLVGRLIDTVLALPSFLITLAFTFLYGTAGAVNGLIAEIGGGAAAGLPDHPGRGDRR